MPSTTYSEYSEPADTADEAQLVAETARDLFTDRCSHEAVDAASAAGWDPDLWALLEESGLTLISVPEASGGSGGTLREAAALLAVAGEFAAPVPLAETALLGGWLLAAAGLEVPTGPLTAATAEQTELTVTRQGSGTFRAVGTVTRVASARFASRVAVLAPPLPAANGLAAEAFDGAPVVIALDPARCLVVPGTNIAGEFRDTLEVDCVIAAADLATAPPAAAMQLRYRAALGRSVLAAGAASRALDLTLRHTSEREQFGRPIGRFQAVQQQVAELAAEVVAIRAAADAAVGLCADSGVDSPAATFAVAAARASAARSAGVVARIAHQMHGAIGFTDEHSLRLATTRLWAWRDEAGAGADWLAELGTRTIAAGRDGFWPLVTGAS